MAFPIANPTAGGGDFSGVLAGIKTGQEWASLKYGMEKKQAELEKIQQQLQQQKDMHQLQKIKGYMNYFEMASLTSDSQAKNQLMKAADLYRKSVGLDVDHEGFKAIAMEPHWANSLVEGIKSLKSVDPSVAAQGIGNIEGALRSAPHMMQLIDSWLAHQGNPAVQTRLDQAGERLKQAGAGKENLAITQLENNLKNISKDADLHYDAIAKLNQFMASPGPISDIGILRQVHNLVNKAGTVMRESEYKQYKDAGSIFDQIQGKLEKAMDGKFLPDNIRADIQKMTQEALGDLNEGTFNKLQTPVEGFISKMQNLEQPQKVNGILNHMLGPRLLNVYQWGNSSEEDRKKSGLDLPDTYTKASTSRQGAPSTPAPNDSSQPLQNIAPQGASPDMLNYLKQKKEQYFKQKKYDDLSPQGKEELEGAFVDRLQKEKGMNITDLLSEDQYKDMGFNSSYSDYQPAEEGDSSQGEE